jgi:Flp pilus assembly protein TadG
MRDSRGNVLPLAAVGLVVMMALVGGGIDMSRAYRVQNRLQSACDAGALAGRRAVGSNGFDSIVAQPAANNYFVTNFDDSTQETTGTTKTYSSTDGGQTVKGVASTQLNLAVMKIFGFQKFTLSVNCSASMGVGNSDVVMVLDTTGSMGSASGTGTRLQALQQAMKNFYATVKTATQGTNARIRYGFVPYSSSVNVGRLLYDEDASYLRDTYPIQSRKMSTPTTTTGTSGTTDGSAALYSSTTYTSSSSCQGAIPADTAWGPNGQPTSSNANSSPSGVQTVTTTTTQPQKRRIYDCALFSGLYYPYYYDQFRNSYTYDVRTMVYQQVSYDVSSFKAFQSVTTPTGDYGATVSSTWDGCIEERGSTNATTFSYSTVSGITPAAAKDLDIDLAPTDDATSWAPMWPEVAYYRTNGSGLTNSATSNYGGQPSSYCPRAAQLLTTMTQATFDAYADSLHAEGSTYLDIGMVWGGRLSSPTGIFSDNVNIAPSNGGEVSRHIIFMTDGIMEPLYYIQSAWGIEWHDRRVTSDGSSNDAARHTSRFRAICDEIKAKGIRVWTISFTSGTNSDLTYCASPKSSFNADDPDELDSAFQEIAKQVGELRITQ